MASAHHGGPMENNDGESVIELLRRQQALQQRFTEQVEGRAKRQWSEGRLNGKDDGDLAFAISADKEKQVVMLDFGKPVEWIGLPPQQAIELAQSLIQKARAITTEPIRIVLH